MISIYKSIDEHNASLQKLEDIEPGCWINAVAPSEQELLYISKKTGAPLDFLKASLDEEETSRIDTQDNVTLFVVDIPFTEMEDNSLTYDTYPVAIIHTEKELITVCLKNSKIFTDFVEGKVKSFFTFKRSRFTLQILYRIASYYLLYLRQIDKKIFMIEKKLYKSMRNKELLQLLSLEKSLFYFSTSLTSNEMTLEKMLKMDMMQRYPEDKDVLEDVITENKQAIEMANIYSNVLGTTMDAFASVISNNLSIVMKFLAAITIIMSIPNMIFGAFGMNVPVPMANYPLAFVTIWGIAISACILVLIILKKRNIL